MEEGHPGEKITLPCGTCIECKLARTRAWAIRCVHESTLHEKNCFITLTYSPAELEKFCYGGSLNKEEFQRFLKRLRKHCGPFRYYHAGEYGEKLQRPHHHACLFGFDFEDKQKWQIRNGVQLYKSETLEKIWGHGHCVIGEVTFESAAYVARYILKKITGEDSDYHYDGRTPEYTTMSRRPGIGKQFFDKYKADIYNQDHVVLKRMELKPPRYYDNLYEILDPEGYQKTKLTRKEKQINKPKKTKTQKFIIMLNNRKIETEKQKKNRKNRSLENE